MNVQCGEHGYIECYIAYWIWRCVPFVLIAVGTCGNIMSLVVLSRPALRKYSTSIYLIFLAVSDLFVLYCIVLRETVYAITGVRFADSSRFSCKTTWWLSYSVAATSVLMLVMLTIERVLMIKAPLFFRTRLTQAKTLKAAIVVVTFVVVLNGHMLFGFTSYDVTESNSSFVAKVTEIDLRVHPCYYVSPGYRKFFKETWHLVVLGVFNIIPITIVVLGNIFIAQALINRQKAIAPTGNSEVNSSCNNPSSTGTVSRTGSNSRSFTKILFVLSCFFLVTTLPYCLYIVHKSQMGEVSNQTVAKMQLAEACIHCLMYSNFTFNFLFYFLNGTLFRKTLKEIIKSVKSHLCDP